MGGDNPSEASYCGRPTDKRKTKGMLVLSWFPFTVSVVLLVCKMVPSALCRIR